MVEGVLLADAASVICKEVIARHFVPEMRYQHERVQGLVNTIAEQITQRMMQESELPRKYVAHVVIMQKNGAGLYSIASCSWNSQSDACYVHQAENSAMRCIVTLFGLAL